MLVEYVAVYVECDRGLGMAEPSTDHVHRNRAVSDKDARCGMAEIVKANPGNIQPVCQIPKA